MKIALLCATRRGLAVLKRLTELVPECELVVFSFREEANEPRFFDSIRECTLARKGSFLEVKRIGSEHLRAFGDKGSVDLTLVVSWRYLLSAEFCSAARLGTFVFHDSLLPAYRGFSPTVWAMINGEAQTGATLFEVAERMDEGNIVGQECVEMGPEEVISSVMERVTEAYLRLLDQHLPALLENSAPRRPQEHSRATYTCRRLPSDNQIDWHAPAKVVFNLIRAVTVPYSGAFTWLGGRKLTIWGASLPSVERPYVGRVPGRVVEVFPNQGSVVLTGDGSVVVSKVQVEGSQPVCGAEVLNGLSLTLGS